MELRPLMGPATRQIRHRSRAIATFTQPFAQSFHLIDFNLPRALLLELCGFLEELLFLS